GAQETGIKKFAVSWGFGEEVDLLIYQPDWIAHTIDDIISQL
ncbi:MAG: HAD family hydrolase, partial [Streptococcus sp.]|nr:HAD family hydrolase [Streptococcus sp.]